MKNVGIEAPLGYFVGLSINIVFITLLNSVIKMFQVSFYIVLLVQIIYILVNINLARKLFKRVYVFACLKFLTAACIIYIFLLVYWTRDLSSYNQPLGTYGTLHSYRYAWISNIIVECKTVPNIGQNIGQSLLTAISSTLSSTRIPHLYLGIWLSMSMVMFFKLIKSLLKQIGVNSKTSSYATLLFVLLGCSVSFKYIQVVDSGYPLLFNGYTDTILGTAIFIILCFVLTNKSDIKSNNLDILVLFAMFSCSYFVAPQNIPVLFFFFSIYLFVSKLQSFPRVGNLKIKMITFIVATLVSIPIGGFFSPSIFRSKIDVPHVDPINNLSFDIVPGFPFTSWSSNETYQQGELLIKQLLESLQNSNLGVQARLLTTADFIASNFMAIALPILGFLVLISVRNKFKEFVQNPQTRYSPDVKAVWIMVLSIVLQMTIPSFLKVSGYKWELTRFAIPFFAIGNLILSVAAFRFVFKNSIKNYIVLATALVALIGPLKFVGYNTVHNLSNIENTFKQDIYFGSGPQIERSFCKIL